MDMSIIISNYNGIEMTSKCIESIRKHTKGIDYEIIVVDDCSTDDSVEYIKKAFPKIKLIVNKRNLGPIVANNLGIMNSGGRYCLMLNNDTIINDKNKYYLILDNDTIIQNNVFKKMVDFMDKNPDVGVTGPNLVHKDGSFQKSCGDTLKPARRVIRDYLLNLFFPENKITDKNRFTEDFHNRICEVGYIKGACYMIRRKTIEEVGLVDEQYYMYAEEMDWQYRIIKKGWKLIHLPYGPVVHFEGMSGMHNEKKDVSNKFEVLAFRNMLLFYKKNYGLLSYTLMRILMVMSLLRKRKRNFDLIKATLSNTKVNTVEPKIKNE